MFDLILPVYITFIEVPHALFNLNSHAVCAIEFIRIISILLMINKNVKKKEDEILPQSYTTVEAKV